MESNLNAFDEEQHIRPTLLTVLCILTFIGSSWLILTNIWAYSTASKTAQMISTVRNETENNPTKNLDSLKAKNNDSLKTHVGQKRGFFFREKMISSFSKIMTAENIRKTALGAIISAIFTLIGALLMWRFKRSGFYLYAVGTLIGLSVPFYLYGINVMSIGISFFSGFFGLIFIALYALNIKSLR
jgi:hypothetical protein